MFGEADLTQLVDTAYRAGTDPGVWPLFLKRMQRAMAANIVGMFIQDMSTQAGAFSFQAGLTPDWQRAFDEYYAPRSPWMAGAARELNVTGNVRISEERCPVSELVKTEFYNDFLRPNRVRHGCGGTILREGSLTANLTCLRGTPAFGDDARALLRLLLPHLRRAVLTYRRLAQARLEEHTVLAALDRLPWGILLVDAAARPLFVNAEGRRLTGRRDGVSIERGALTARQSTHRASLLALIARAARPGGGGGSLAVGRPTRRPLGVDIVPLILGEASDPSRLVAVFIADPDGQHESDERILGRFYGLTAAEAALAARLAAGDSLEEAAARRQIGKETARTHLRQILRKTGTRRQAELVLRLHRGPLRVAQGPNELEPAAQVMTDRHEQAARALASLRRAAGLEVLDRLPYALIVVDAAGRPAVVNATARRVIAAGDLRDDEGRLRAPDAAEDGLLQRAILMATAPGAAWLSGSMALTLTMKGIAVPVLVLPAGRSVDPILMQHGLGLIVFGDTAATGKRQLLSEMYGLTPREADLADLLMQGRNLAEAAGELGTSVATVRTHLGRLLEKTGTSRQGELLRILATSTSPE